MQFGANWDLVAERAGGPVTVVPPLDLSQLLADIGEVVTMADGCTDAEDKLLARLGELRTWASAASVRRR